MIEAFGAGTAAIVSPVQLIHFAGTDYKVRAPNCGFCDVRCGLVSFYVCIYFVCLFVCLSQTLCSYSVSFVTAHVQVPLNKADANAKAGAFTQRVWNEITDIQYGRKAFRDWSVVID